MSTYRAVVEMKLLCVVFAALSEDSLKVIQSLIRLLAGRERDPSLSLSLVMLSACDEKKGGYHVLGAGISRIFLFWFFIKLEPWSSVFVARRLNPR